MKISFPLPTFSAATNPGKGRFKAVSRKHTKYYDTE